MPQDFTTGQVLTAAQMDTLSGAVDGYATTVTSAGTLTLTTASLYQQFFTGSTTHSLVMPVTTTLYVGQKWRIVNNSSGVVTVKTSDSTTIYAVPAGSDVIVTCILASGTTAASWDYKDASLAGSSKVVQIVTATHNTYTSNSTSTYADTGLTATITPTSASNKVLVFFSQNGVYVAAANTWVQIRLRRASTTILTAADRAANNVSSTNINVGSVSGEYLDSPATTSATIYKTEFMSGNNIASAHVQHSAADSTIVLMEVTP